MPSDLYKCMYVISKDEYDTMKKNGKGNNIDSGIGGDVTDSHVHNIDVSSGGTLVINDGGKNIPQPISKARMSPHSCKISNRNNQNSSAKKKKCNDESFDNAPARVISVPSNNVPMLMGSSSDSKSYASPSTNLQNAKILPNSYVPPLSILPSSSGGPSEINTFDNSKLPNPMPPPILTSTKLPISNRSARKDTFENSKMPSPMPPPVFSSSRKSSSSSTSKFKPYKLKSIKIRNRTPTPHPIMGNVKTSTRKLNPVVMQKSRSLLKDMMKKRLMELTGYHPSKIRKSASVSASEIIHDIRKLSNGDNHFVPGYNLQRRQVDRYRLQKTPISPYQDNSGQFVPLPPDSEFDTQPTPKPPRRKPVRKLVKRPEHNTSTQDILLDPFHYEPRKKISNTRQARVRAVGAIAGVKRTRDEDDDDDYINLYPTPNKLLIRDVSSIRAENNEET